MPAILTHYTFALSAMPDKDKPYEALTRLGSQGPDAFMAYGTIPWRKRENKEKIQGWGHVMHALPVGSVYLKMLDYALHNEDKDILLAYLDGLLMHYAVDRIFHPYIFYRSGFDGNGKLTGFYSFSHGKFEAILDKNFTKKRGTYQPLFRCILSPEEQVKKVSKMWAACSPSHLDELDFFHSYEDFVSAEKMLYTPRGFKRPLFRLIGKYSTPYAQSHPLRIHRYDYVDAMNVNKAKWLDPCTGEEKDLSIEEMFEISLKEFKQVYELLRRGEKGEDIAEEFVSWTRNLDHDGTPIGMKKTHQSLCWKEKGR